MGVLAALLIIVSLLLILAIVGWYLTWKIMQNVPPRKREVQAAEVAAKEGQTTKGNTTPVKMEDSDQKDTDGVINESLQSVKKVVSEIEEISGEKDAIVKGEPKGRVKFKGEFLSRCKNISAHMKNALGKRGKSKSDSAVRGTVSGDDGYVHVMPPLQDHEGYIRVVPPPKAKGRPQSELLPAEEHHQRPHSMQVEIITEQDDPGHSVIVIEPHADDKIELNSKSKANESGDDNIKMQRNEGYGLNVIKNPQAEGSPDYDYVLTKLPVH